MDPVGTVSSKEQGACDQIKVAGFYLRPDETHHSIGSKKD